MPGRPPTHAHVFLVLAVLLLAACGRAAPGRVADRRSVLEVASPVVDAVLWVDGRYVAQLRDLPGGIRLSPGAHQIEVRHDRYHAYYGEIELAPGQRLRLDVELAEKLR